MPAPEEPVREFSVEPVLGPSRAIGEWEVPIPDDLTEAARQIAACAAVPDPSWETNGMGLDSVEVVWLSDGGPTSFMGGGGPGIQLTWHQGEDRYGLLVKARDLIEGERTIAGAAFDLWLAIDEPQHSPPRGVVAWFFEA